MRRFRNAVGPLIRKARTQRGLTQEALAAKLQIAGLDLDRKAVAKIEARLRSVYDFELAVLARVLGRSPEELYPPYRSIDKALAALQRGVVARMPRV